MIFARHAGLPRAVSTLATLMADCTQIFPRPSVYPSSNMKKPVQRNDALTA